MKKTMILRGLSLATLAFVAAACSSAPTESDGLAEGPGVGESVVFDGYDFAIVDSDDAGVPNFIVGRLGQVRFGAGARASEIERVMFPILEKTAPMFRMKPEEMTLSRVESDREGDLHLRFQQVRNGLEVIGGEIIVHVKGGLVTAVNGSARGDLAAPVEVAFDRASAVVSAQRFLSDVQDLAVADEGDQPFAYKIVEERMELVHRLEVTGSLRDGTPVLDTVLVSAKDGAVLARMPHIHTAKNRELHDLAHGTSLPGTTVRTEGQAPLSSSANNDPINNNYDRLGTVWDCYKNLFNRDSFDNAGAKLISSVHYSNNYVNAYWNGTQMVYGDGDNVNASNLANSMDVTGHELTHAVTERTSNLVYSGESGGLNESISDIFGNVCEWYRDGQPATPSANNWMVGEDIWTPATSGDALRYMNDPAKDGASLDYWTSTAGSKDVHYSSGISNLAFYLLSQGGTHPRGKSTISVTGIGIAKAAQIFYKAQIGYLTSSSNFAAAKTATEQAAAALGYTTAEIASVTAAWEAVGVGVSGGGGGTGGSCSHDKCSSGSALTSSCNSVVSTVCASDSYCCTTSWDSLCVKENRTIGLSLACSESNGSCTHSLCTTGAKLTNKCDSAKANCVVKICAADSYCCNTGWDSTCVAEVASICGKNCN